VNVYVVDEKLALIGPTVVYYEPAIIKFTCFRLKEQWLSAVVCYMT